MLDSIGTVTFSTLVFVFVFGAADVDIALSVIIFSMRRFALLYLRSLAGRDFLKYPSSPSDPC